MNQDIARIKFTFGKPDGIGKRLVEATLDDTTLSKQRFDPYQPQQRKPFSEAVVMSLGGAGFNSFEDAVAAVEAEFLPAVNGLPAADDEAAAIHSPVARYMANVQPRELEWIWPGRIPLGKYTLLCSDPGLGKTFLLLDIMARITTATKWPDCDELARLGGCIILTAEDDIDDTIRPRLDAAGADVSKIVTLDAVQSRDGNGEYKRAFDLQRDLDVIEQTIDTMLPDCKLVGIDPISAYMGKIDSHKNAEVRSVLSPLQELAARRRIAVVGITHLRKGEGQAVYRAMGSLAFIAAARSAWCLTKDRNDADGKRRLFLPVKCNLSADNNGLAFQLTARHTGTQPCVEWEADPVTTTADEALEPEQRRRGPEPEAHDEAIKFLSDALADGPRPTKEIEQEANDGFGISKRTLKRARSELKVESFRPVIPGPWMLRLPNSANNSANIPRHELLGTLGTLADNPEEIEVFDPFESNSAKYLESGTLGQNGHDPDAINRLLAEAVECEE